MYDLVTPLLNSVAGGPCAIHHGYWENDGRASWQQAADRLTDLVAERTVLDGGVRLLDVGCGTGQPALRVARDNAIQITGITVSQVQVAIAADCARERGLSHRVDFSCVDAMSLPYPDNAFDAAWAMQSLLEMSEPDRAIREILRVLKPGGILGVTEVVKREAGGGMPVSGDRWPTGLRICLAEQLLESLRAAGSRSSIGRTCRRGPGTSCRSSPKSSLRTSTGSRTGTGRLSPTGPPRSAIMRNMPTTWAMRF
ncbi:SAM-dependent methyltransferase [Saccharopolyspora spinosa]|uniref:SAM-dependent methyltransferase n=1 Tax=Saccharopolyspora spinosa TaxID=60894 RepID=UPI00376ED504